MINSILNRMKDAINQSSQGDVEACLAYSKKPDTIPIRNVIVALSNEELKSTQTEEGSMTFAKIKAEFYFSEFLKITEANEICERVLGLLKREFSSDNLTYVIKKCEFKNTMSTFFIPCVLNLKITET